MFTEKEENEILEEALLQDWDYEAAFEKACHREYENKWAFKRRHLKKAIRKWLAGRLLTRNEHRVVCESDYVRVVPVYDMDGSRYVEPDEGPNHEWKNEEEVYAKYLEERS